MGRGGLPVGGEVCRWEGRTAGGRVAFAIFQKGLLDTITNDLGWACSTYGLRWVGSAADMFKAICKLSEPPSGTGGLPVGREVCR